MRGLPQPSSTIDTIRSRPTTRHEGQLSQYQQLALRKFYYSFLEPSEDELQSRSDQVKEAILDEERGMWSPNEWLF